jgi:hypothetical protein
MAINDYEPWELNDEVLSSEFADTFNIKLGDFIEILPVLKRLQVLMEMKIRSKRLWGLAEASPEEDKLKCAYVRKAIIELLRSPQDFDDFRSSIKELAGVL